MTYNHLYDNHVYFLSYIFIVHSIYYFIILFIFIHFILQTWNYVSDIYNAETKTHTYSTWTEYEAERGSDEIASNVLNYIMRNCQKYKKIRLFMDNCPGECDYKSFAVYINFLSYLHDHHILPLDDKRLYLVLKIQ